MRKLIFATLFSTLTLSADMIALPVSGVPNSLTITALRDWTTPFSPEYLCIGVQSLFPWIVLDKLSGSLGEDDRTAIYAGVLFTWVEPELILAGQTESFVIAQAPEPSTLCLLATILILAAPLIRRKLSSASLVQGPPDGSGHHSS